LRIFVTGGTGFVGSHSVAALVRGGHEVRMLVRSPDRIASALGPHGLGEQDHAIGDVTDPASVEEGMKGCDAVLHAASIYSLDVREAKKLHSVNVEGTKTVLGTAEKLGLDPIVYVSSFVALFPPNGEVLNEDSELKDPPGQYYKSKAEAEGIAREFQARGVPVVSSYPSGAFGPLDPHFGESAQTVTDIVKRRLLAVPRGGFSMVDIRDVAAAHNAMFEAGKGARRYVLSGTNLPIGDVIGTLSELTGRRLPHVTMPGWTLAPFVHTAGFLQRILPFRLPLNTEGFNAVRWNPHGDDSRARADLGFSPREPRETLADTVTWLYAAGRISAKQAGKLAPAPDEGEQPEGP
jgi:nucleoside-diphosphate-sugar epimerase